jgi:hypothetical protein
MTPYSVLHAIPSIETYQSLRVGAGLSRSQRAQHRKGFQTPSSLSRYSMKVSRSAWVASSEMAEPPSK